MAAATRPPAAPPADTPARALLAAFDPHLTLPVLHLTWRPTPRVAELRANALLLYRPDAPRDPAAATSHVALTATTPVRQSTPLTLRVGRHSLRFYAASDAAAFLHALRAVLAALTRARAPGAELPAAAPPPQHLATLAASPVVTVSLARAPDGGLRARKAVAKSHALSPARLPATIAERSALARLTAAGSPFYPRLRAAAETDGHLVLETEYAARGSLRGLLDRSGPLRAPVLRALAAELVLALADLHALDLLSRAVRTDHVLLSAAGHVRLLGLGLSTRVVLAHAGLPRLGDDGALSDASGTFSTCAPGCGCARCARASRAGSDGVCALRSDGSVLSDVTSDADAGAGSESDGSDASTAPAACVPAAWDCPRAAKRASTTEGMPPLARTRGFVGARHFMAPEMLRAGARGASYGAKADVWALGLTLHEAATGRHAFADALAAATDGDGGDGSELYAAICGSDVRVRAEDVGGDDRLADLLCRMLRRDETERLDLADVFAHDFFAGVDWAAVRSAARADAPVPDVMKLAPLRFDDLPAPTDSAVASAPAEPVPQRRRRGSSASSEEELLGFGFFVADCAA